MFTSVENFFTSLTNFDGGIGFERFHRDWMKIYRLCTCDPLSYQPKNLKRTRTNSIEKEDFEWQNSLLDVQSWKQHFSKQTDVIVKQIVYSSKLNSEAIDIINCEALDNGEYVKTNSFLICGLKTFFFFVLFCRQ